MNFEELVVRIKEVHDHLALEAVKAVNLGLTLRNWLIGFHLFEFEQCGTDRASYGKKLLDRVAERLSGEGLERVDVRELSRYRQLYLTYPQIRETLSPEITDRFTVTDSGDTVSRIGLSASRLLQSLSFSHLAELIKIGDPLKRAFYEVAVEQKAELDRRLADFGAHPDDGRSWDEVRDELQKQ